MEPTIQDLQNQIVEDLSYFEDWDEKYQYIIDLGKHLAPLSDEFKVSSNIIKGCQSNVWLTSSLEGDKIIYQADSDAIISKGLVSMLIKVLSGHTPDEILNTEIDFLDRVGMKQHLSPTRSNGLSAMLKQMKLYALAYKSKIANKI
ncbi:MAG TPA: SufE family protein [Cytophagaceae bacterium]|jgi:cysteine desulfuration protein SufE